MFWLRSWPRCQGDLYDNENIYGNYIDCLPFGHYLTAEEEEKVRLDSPHGRRYMRPPDCPVRVLTEIAA